MALVDNNVPLPRHHRSCFLQHHLLPARQAHTGTQASSARPTKLGSEELGGLRLVLRLVAVVGGRLVGEKCTRKGRELGHPSLVGESAPPHGRAVVLEAAQALPADGRRRRRRRLVCGCARGKGGGGGRGAGQGSERRHAKGWGWGGGGACPGLIDRQEQSPFREVAHAAQTHSTHGTQDHALKEPPHVAVTMPGWPFHCPTSSTRLRRARHTLRKATPLQQCFQRAQELQSSQPASPLTSRARAWRLVHGGRGARVLRRRARHRQLLAAALELDAKGAALGVAPLAVGKDVALLRAIIPWPVRRGREGGK